MNVIEALEKRYATKKFNPDKKLSAKVVDQIIEAARLTATSYGAQLMKIVRVEKQEIREKLVSSSFGQKQIVDASDLLIICRERDLDLIHFEKYVENVSKTRGVALEKLDGFKNMMAKSILTKSEEEQVRWMEKQCYIMLGNLLNTCALLEVDSCPMEGFIPEEYDRILGLEAMNLASVLALPIGFRADDDPNFSNAKVRRSTEDFLVRI